MLLLTQGHLGPSAPFTLSHAILPRGAGPSVSRVRDTGAERKENSPRPPTYQGDGGRFQLKLDWLRSLTRKVGESEEGEACLLLLG